MSIKESHRTLKEHKRKFKKKKHTTFKGHLQNITENQRQLQEHRIQLKIIKRR